MYIIPKPKNIIIEENSSFFMLDWNSRLVFHNNLREKSLFYGKIIQKCIKKSTGFDISIVCGAPKPGDIYFSYNDELASQEYSLVVKDDGVFCCGKDDSGVLYGLETLCQIIEQRGSCLQFMEIKDSPDFPVRGYYLDQSRGRVYKLDYLKHLADKMARYKINQFQLYIEHTYLFSDLSEMWRNETPLTAEEILELDKYCASLNIELVPSLSSFGHLFTLLNTKTYNKYCEKERIEGASGNQFSFYERMQHHTVNVSDPEVLPFIESLLEEYMALFSSNKFNLCADETFDLGKGKSKALADEKGVHRIYIDYVKAISQFLVSKGKIPMFWGDIICGEPDLVKELPEEIICLNWGYAPEQLEDPTRKMAATGVKQYLCPGVCGWNQWMNLIENSYKNITRMCGFGQKYNAIGILNTDWGDFGHINEPQYSIPGMIYGAAFSWNNCDISFDEINREISKIEYNDSSESIVGLMSDISKNMNFDWCTAVFYYEKSRFGKTSFHMDELKYLGSSNITLDNIKEKLIHTAVKLDSSSRPIIQYISLSIECIKLWNIIGDILKKKEDNIKFNDDDAKNAAAGLEYWFMKFKDLWRSETKEGDLHYIGEIIFWYCDMLRG